MITPEPPVNMNPECCGHPMAYTEIWGIRIHQCQHRKSHPETYMNLYTGQTITDTDLTWTYPETNPGK